MIFVSPVLDFVRRQDKKRSRDGRLVGQLAEMCVGAEKMAKYQLCVGGVMP